MQKKSRLLVNESKGYKVINTSEAKKIVSSYLSKYKKLKIELITYGLPEIDDRHHIWRVPVKGSNKRIGEIVIDAKTAKINKNKSSDMDFLIKNLTSQTIKKRNHNKNNKLPKPSTLEKSFLIQGDAKTELDKLPKESVNLIFTSPPYYNAKPEYSEYSSYEEYLKIMRKVIRSCFRVLGEGRFFVINVSPVLVRRASRSEASKRIAVPFDFHRIFIEEGFDFIDDIHWVKPEGAGWALGRGRRFAADRNPLQYKAVPITEYILVYRKTTKRLIDWNIRKHHSSEDVKNSRIGDNYEKTNLWKIHPSHSKLHPATFPLELAEKVISYYSFKNDFVLDPFAGIGTTGKAALKLNRKFVLTEIEPEYVSHIKDWIVDPQFSLSLDNVEFINNEAPKVFNQAFDFEYDD